MRNRLAIAAALFVLAAAPAAPQGYAPAAGASWKRVTVACSASPTFNLTEGTAFLINLCSTAATANFTNLAAANGKGFSVVACQDTTGGRAFNYPNTVWGAAAVSTLPRICTAQSFVVIDGQIFATSTAAQQASYPAPALYAAPWNSMTYNPADGVITIANELGGVVLSANSAWSQSQFNGKFKGYALSSPSSDNGKTSTVIATFWIEQPDTTGTNSYGFGSVNGSSNSEYCVYMYGNGVSNISQHTYGTFDNVFGTATPTFNFLDAAHQLTMKWVQIIQTTGTSTNNFTTCSWSDDGGGTWHNFTGRQSQNTFMVTSYWAIGGSEWPKPTGAKMHVTSLSVSKQ